MTATELAEALGIPSDVQGDLIDRTWQSAVGEVLPSQKFFLPTQEFWDTMHGFGPDPRWMDCGTGDGHIVEEARIQGLAMSGCDIYRRADAPPDIHILPAHRIPWTKPLWALVCRPDHSGWCPHLFNKVREAGCGFVYVGLADNLELDMAGVETTWDEFVAGVGHDDEAMWVWLPEGEQRGR